MRIGQARDDSFSAEINGPCPFRLIFFRLRIQSNENNPVSLDRDRFGARLALVHRVDVAVNENRFSRLGTEAERAGREKKETRQGFHRAPIIASSSGGVEPATLQ